MRGGWHQGYAAITSDEEDVKNAIHDGPAKTCDLKGNLEGCHEGHIRHQKECSPIPVKRQVTNEFVLEVMRVLID